jgi:hypothetical protein
MSFSLISVCYISLFLSFACAKLRINEQNAKEKPFSFHFRVKVTSSLAKKLRISEQNAGKGRLSDAFRESLTAAGITIPFPQCDVHLIPDS